ncbi:MAG: efflux transporter outer membrane subunit [Candidatus Babeliales bacterium]|jgi:NodT family efflux transporter outer membrane factor (OMF) lipoprotein
MNAQPVLIIATLTLLPCCMVGPKYKKPCPQLPNAYAEEKLPREIADLAQWWTFFDDPYLDELIKKALANNYNLRIAREKIEEARAYYRIKNADLYPEVNVVGNVNRTGLSKNYNKYLYLSPKTTNYFQIGFDASWELDFWGKLRRARAAAYADFQAQIEAMHEVYLILLSDVAKAYVDSRSFQKKIDLLNEQITVDTDILSLRDDRYSSGVDSQIPDVNQLAALDESKKQALSSQIELQQTINRLALLLGLNPEEFNLAPAKHDVPMTHRAPAVGLPSDLVQRRPDIRRAERLLAAATENFGYANTAWFPSFSLLGGSIFEANKGSNWFSGNSISWTIGPALNWPLITFGRIKYDVQEKRSAQRQAILSYAQSVVNALTDVEDWLVAYFKLKDQVAVLTEKLSAATTQRDLYASQFEGGLANKMDLLQAEKNRISIELELTNTQQALSSALISLYKALGGGWE